MLAENMVLNINFFFIQRAQHFVFSMWFLQLLQLTFRSSIMKQDSENKYIHHWSMLAIPYQEN